MELPIRLPVLSAQCYSPSPDHAFGGRRASSSSRQPLQESTGNIQHLHMAWYAQHLEALSSIPSSMAPLMAPVLRTQSLGGPDYGAPAYTRSQQRHEHQLHGRRREQGSNPLMPLLSHNFQSYRKKQASKPDQKWPEELEGFFLDAILLIPQMGRDKYTMKKSLWGRNQLIGEYLWIASLQGLAPGAEPDPQVSEIKGSGKMRKKVSSHIQVLKSFFKAHRCYHFLFGERQRDTQKVKDSVGKASLKNNPVLTALSEDRFPSERPNYEYFAQILALNKQVQFRPKRCWIFVSHKDVVVGEDRSGYLAGTATGSELSESEYPHLPRNLDRETWAKEEQQLFKGALLHEFTKEIKQRESGSVRELTKDWDSAFPDLQSRLKTITSTTTDARCDFLHLHATLELKEKRSFPAGSSLSSWVEINIEQPRLLNHRWKVETRLVRPWELSSDDALHGDPGQEVIHERQKEFTIKYQHRAGCEGSLNDGRGQCDCHTQRSRRDGVSVPFPVPFPATAWAQTLTNCAEYPAHPYGDSRRHDRDGGPAIKVEKEDDEKKSRSRRGGKQLTQMDLVSKIAMMQEISSCPPSSPHEEGSSDSANQRWTRRAVILWTFETIHSTDKEGTLVTAPGGKTDWRFLTILDPASEYHQRHAISSGRRSSADEYRGVANSAGCGSRPSSRATVMSPSPTYQQHLGGSMSENFPSAWDTADGLGSLTGSAAQAAYGAHFMSQTMPSHTPSSQTGYGLLDSFSSHSGLATPPPSASLGSSFAQPFDTASTGSDMLPSYMGTHAAVTTGGMDAGSHALSAVTDPFLAHVGATYGGAQDGIHGWDSHGVSGAMDPSAAATSWQSGYPNPNPTHLHNGWSGPQPQPHPRRSSDHHRHNTQYHRQDRHTQPWAPTITTNPPPHSNSMDDSDPWTPITSATPSGGGEPNNAAARADSHDHHPHHHSHSHSHHHNPTTSEASHNQSQSQSQSQEWVHIHPSSTSTANASDPDPEHEHEQDLSQDWEETPTTLPGIGVDQQLRSLSPPSQQGRMVVQGLKRARSEDEFGEGEGGEGYRRARRRS